MYDAVITFVTVDPEIDLPHAGQTITKVFRLEFESEQQFNEFLAQGARICTEMLTSNE